MASRQDAIRNARQAEQRSGRPMFIYRIGAAWMYTSSSKEKTQELYKVPIRDFQAVAEIKQ
jgi:hypothetical protein